MTTRSNTGPEFTLVQRPAWELLKDQFGYEYADGESSGFAAERESESEPLLIHRLSRKLRDINPGLSDEGVRQAIAALRQPLASPLIDANDNAYRLLSRWVTVEETQHGKLVGRSVRYIDFDVPENNEFLVVDEFTMKGPRYTRRMDLVLFINGIPIVVMECKEPGDDRGIEHGVRDLRAYQDPDKGVVRLFHTVQLCVALKRADARYGTVCTELPRYAEWKTVYPISRFDLERQIGRTPTRQDILLAGMLSKENLLDLIRNFIVFDRDGGKLVKKVARYQQFEAVNEAVKRIVDPTSTLPLKDRGGVVWHTQGSGKSLSMLWLGLKLRRQKELNNPTLLIVSDRRDLDRQITQTFSNCGFENPVRASRVKHLRKLLNGPPGQTVMTTVQKFRDEVDIQRGSRHPVLSDAKNIFTLIDEAHRSEYGQFAAHMKMALPNACRLAFTGTPIDKTQATFGGYIHKYTMPQSVEDGATIPILYESRLPELAVWGKRLDPLFETEFAHLTKEQRQKLTEQEVTERKIAESKDRIEMIAQDIAEHYKANFEPDGFKAQVAACSQRAAGMYYEELRKHFPDRVALLISDPSDKDSELWELKKPFENEEPVIDQFKDEGADKLAIIVVMNKYLTGFDAPLERVLYLDRRLTDHNLLQAIARVNRPLPEKDKQWGLIVDYWGVSGFLDKALEVFSQDVAVEDVLHRRDDEAAYQALKQRHADVLAMFPDSLDRSDIEPWILALEKEDIRAIFHARYRAFYKALEQLLPDPRALRFLPDFAWLRRVRREANTHYQTEDVEISDCSEKVRELIDRHVKGEDVKQLLEPIPIMSDRFSEEIKKLKDPRAKASRMEHAIQRTITVKLHEDPVFYESIKDRLKRIIDERRDQRIDDAEEFKLLMRLRDDIKDGQAEDADTLGVREEAFPFYGLLKKHMASPSADGTAKLAELSDAVFDALKQEAVIDWAQKEDVQREMRRKVKRQLRLADFPTDDIEAVTTAVMDLARVRLS